MAQIKEHKLTDDIRSALAGGSREAISGLKLSASADFKTIVEAIDQFVFDWQDGKRPPPEAFDTPEDVPVALGCLWGDQLVKRFGWEWVLISFGRRGDDMIPAVVSPDRSLVVYPITSVASALEDSSIDCTIALSYNILESGKVGKQKAKGYLNLLEGVYRIVPRR